MITTDDDKLDGIKLGMTKKEVQDILGQPSYASSRETDDAERMRWDFPGEGVIYVYFVDGKAAVKKWGDRSSRKPKRSLKEIIRDRFKKLGL